MVDFLLPWAPFFYSFGPGLFVIKILADWLRIRLYFPLGADQKPRMLIKESSASMSTAQLDELRKRYDKMNYQELRNVLMHQTDSGIISPLTQDFVEALFASRAEKRYHIHHFVFGIPTMFLSWGLFVYGEPWWGLLVAGIIAALFLSELKELITQQWQP